MERSSSVICLMMAALFVGCHTSMEAVRECRSQFKLDSPKIKADEVSEDVKCFSECILKKTGCMDDAGNLVNEKIQEELTKMAKTDEQKAGFEKAVADCTEKIKSSNPTGKCEKGYEFMKCVRTAKGENN